MRRRATKAQAFRAGVIALVVILVGCYFGFTKANPFADRFELRGAFEHVNDLKKGSQVRIAGVNVGKVTDVQPVDETSELGRKGAGAIVTMEIEDEGRVDQVTQGISIPFLPALAWRLAGRVPTPIGRLTDKRNLDAKVWDRT